MHGLLWVFIYFTGYESIGVINKNSYYQNILAKSDFIVLTCLLSIFHFDYTNWLQRLSSAVSYLILICLIIWMVQNMIKFEENDEHVFLLFPAYLPRYQIFGLIDLLQDIISALSLIIIEYYPIVNITVFLAIKILYIKLLKNTSQLIIIKYSYSVNQLIF